MFFYWKSEVDLFCKHMVSHADSELSYSNVELGHIFFCLLNLFIKQHEFKEGKELACLDR